MERIVAFRVMIVFSQIANYIALLLIDIISHIGFWVERTAAIQIMILFGQLDD